MVKSQNMVDTKGMDRKLRRLAKSVRQSGTATVRELVEIGKVHMQRNVPKHTHQTYNAINGQTLPQANGDTKGSVFIELRARTEGNRTTHDVARFMAEGKPTPGHFKTGKPHFMQLTRTYLNRIKKQVGQRNMKVSGTSSKTTIG